MSHPATAAHPAPVQQVARLLDELRTLEAEHGPLTFASSLGAEDMVLTDIIASQFPAIDIFTLDTGRLPEATHRLIAECQRRYDGRPRILFPEREEVEALVNRHGANLFRDSVELRQSCCAVRKVAPLARALAGKGGWITGLRRSQAPTREHLNRVEFDEGHGLMKLNPLLDWSHDEVWAYIHAYGVAYNTLHDQGYPSIGCAPCTRPVQPGEDIRAGRWWWEHPEHKECGLHPAGTEGGA